MGIVLAAGSGTRFGMPKVLAADWLSRAVDALSAGGCADVVVVLGAAVVDVPAPARRVIAEGWADGMAASLRAGLRAIADGGGDPVVVHVVDSPDVMADVVARVLAAVGIAPVALEPDRISVSFNGSPVCVDGAGAPGARDVDLSGADVDVTVSLGLGDASASIRTTDLSHAYVEENSAYSS